MPNPSPFRYPGGKSWLIPYVRRWLSSLSVPIRFLEPFAGGANVGLTVALENLAEHVTLVELDRNVAAVWQVLLGNEADALVEKIVRFPISKAAVEATLRKNPRSQLSRAFSTLLKNRVRRGGIMTEDASLLKLGENGRGVKSRWYPETLKGRIETISRNRGKITFYRADGVEFIRLTAHNRNLALFVDPPYISAGQRLYTHCHIDHRSLFEILRDVSGSWLLTYENTKEVKSLAKEFGFLTKSIRMRTAHHSTKTELLISRDFSWLAAGALSPKRP